MNVAHSTLTTRLHAWDSATKACDQNLTCVTAQDTKAASYFTDFSRQLEATPVPADARIASTRLDSDAVLAARDFTELSQATTSARYESVVSASGLQRTLRDFDADYSRFISRLGFR